MNSAKTIRNELLITQAELAILIQTSESYIKLAETNRAVLPMASQSLLAWLSDLVVEIKSNNSFEGNWPDKAILEKRLFREKQQLEKTLIDKEEVEEKLKKLKNKSLCFEKIAQPGFGFLSEKNRRSVVAMDQKTKDSLENMQLLYFSLSLKVTESQAIIQFLEALV